MARRPPASLEVSNLTFRYPGSDVQALREVAFAVACRGSYLAVPCVLVDGRPVPLLGAAVPLDVTTPGQRIDLTVHVDAAQIAEARR